LNAEVLGLHSPAEGMELVTLKQLFQRLNEGRLLGLDVGIRNIGIAVSDPHCRIASQVCKIHPLPNTL
jgi:hypothetical protein